MDLTNIIKELNSRYTKFKFNIAKEVYSAEAIITITVKKGEEDLAYYSGDDYGYCVLDRAFYEIKAFIQSELPSYTVIDFIDGKRSGSFEILN